MSSSQNGKLEITIDRRVFFYSVFIVAALVAVWFFKGIFAMLFIAYIINTGLRPVVDALETKKIPRVVSIIGIYLLLLIILSAIVIFTANSFISQVQSLFNALPEIADNILTLIQETVPAAERILPFDALRKDVAEFSTDAQKSSFFNEVIKRENLLVVASGAYGIFGSVADILIRIFTVMMVAGYMLARKHFYQPLVNYIPARRKETLLRTMDRINESLGTWIIGQLALMTFIGIITYFVLIIPGFFFGGYQLDEYAIPIALVAALLEALPTVGPFVTALIAGLFAVGTSGVEAVLYVGVTFTLLQNIEATLLVPMVMKRAVGVDPIISILAIIGGFQVYGIIGAAFVIPLLGIIKIVLSEVSGEYRLAKNNNLSNTQMPLNDAPNRTGQNSKRRAQANKEKK